MQNHKLNTEGFWVPLFLVLSMVLIQLMDLPGCYGIVPRYLVGVKGILLAPLFHSGWEHLFSNAVPLFILSFMVFNFYKRLAYLLLIFGWFFTGVLVWLFADLGIFPSDNYIGCHIGASGLVYVLASFVFFSGLFRKSIPLIAVSLVVVFLYGGLIWGIFPEDLVRYSTKQSHISWESHLAGSLVGLFFAITWRKIGPQKATWAWKEKGYYNKKDEALWQKYLDMEAFKNKTNVPEKRFEIKENVEIDYFYE